MIAAVMNPADAIDGVRGMVGASRNFSRAFRSLKRPVQLDQRKHQAEQSGPDGKWTPRSRATLAKATARPRGKTRKGHRRHRRKLRALLGSLPRRIYFRFTRTAIAATSRVPWADIHQTGGTAGGGAKIPARPFLWVSDELAATARKALLDHVYGGWLRHKLGWYRR